MMKNKINLWGCLLIMVLANFANAGDSRNKLKYFRNIEMKKGEGGIAAVTLDKEIYNKIESFSDIRITDNVGNEIPFRINRQFTKRKINTMVVCDSKILSLKKMPDNKIEIIVKNLEKKFIPQTLTIVTENKNYDKEVSIAIGNEENKYGKSVKDQAIFDYSDIIDLSNNTVTLPQGKGKYYKIIIGNFSEVKQSRRMELIEETRRGQEFSEIKKKILSNENFRIKKLILKAKQVSYKNKALVTEHVPAELVSNKTIDKQTELIMQVYRQPVVSFLLVTPSQNFTRSVNVYGSKDKKSWIYLTRDKITKINIGGLKRNELDMKIPENRLNYLKISIDNGDGPTLDIDDVKVSAAVYNAEFIAPANGQDLKFYYGGDLPAPEYDIDEILANINNPKITYLKLGEAKTNPDFSDKEETSFLENKVLLYVVIGLMVLVLGGALVSGMKKIENVDSDS